MLEGLEFYIGLTLIVIGALVYLFLLQDSVPRSTKKLETLQSFEMTEEEKAALAKAKADERSKELEDLVVPVNFPEVSIYFGSQTGTAEKFAQQLTEEADDLGVEKANVVDFNNFSEEAFTKHKLVIVCVATHYEGDPCDNTRAFWKWLKNECKDKTAKPL